MSVVNSGLTTEQVKQYFAHIQLPERFRSEDHPLNLEFLASIQAHHLCRIPYENLALHYSPNPSISLDVRDIYRKFVERHRGGYCMENNIFLHHVLRALGFQAYMAGARLFRQEDSPNPGWSGWEHAVNIVTLPEGQYLVDVGYGGDGPTIPLPLTAEKEIANIGTQKLRLLHGSMPGLANGAKNLWTYQFRNDDAHPWKSAYAFYEIEFFQPDFEVMSFFTSQSASCFLTSHLLVIKFLREGEKVYGKKTLEDAKVKENKGGKSVLIQTCQTEEERIQALRDHFDINNLTEEEQSAIFQRVSAIKPLP